MRIQKNMTEDRMDTVIFNLHQIKRRTLVLGHPVELRKQQNLCLLCKIEGGNPGFQI